MKITSRNIKAICGFLKNYEIMICDQFVTCFWRIFTPTCVCFFKVILNNHLPIKGNFILYLERYRYSCQREMCFTLSSMCALSDNQNLFDENAKPRVSTRGEIQRQYDRSLERWHIMYAIISHSISNKKNPYAIEHYQKR